MYNFLSFSSVIIKDTISPKKLIPSMIEESTINPLEGLINVVMGLNVIILILIIYLLINILVLIFSDQINKMISNSLDSNSKGNTKSKFNFLFTIIKGISKRSSIINIIIIYCILLVAIISSIYFLYAINLNLESLSLGYLSYLKNIK